LTSVYFDENISHNSSASYLGTGHTYFWSCIDVDATMRFSTDTAANSVRDSYDQSSSLFTVA